MIKNAMVGVLRITNQDCDANTNFDCVIEYVACFALTTLATCVRVSLQIEMINARKRLTLSKAHSIESLFLDERIIRNETDDSIALAQTRFGPFEEANISVVKTV